MGKAARQNQPRISNFRRGVSPSAKSNDGQSAAAPFNH